MKLTELRDELTARAGESEQHAYDDLLPGVRRKVRSTKRNRIAVAGAAAVAIVAAGIVPGLTDSSVPDPATSSTPPTGPDGMPSREPVWDPARDLNKNGITFLHRIAGETLLGGTIGDTGQAEIRATVVPRSAEIGLRYFCNSKARNARYQILIGGKVVVDGTDCTQSPMTDPLHESGSTIRSLRPASEVGKPLRFVMRVIDGTTGKPVRDASILLAAGIYDPGPQHHVSGTVKIPERYQHQGFEYRLTRSERAELRPGAKLEVVTPADTPFLVAYGGHGGGAVAIDLICGNTQGNTDWTGLGTGAYAWAMCPARPSGRPEMRWSGQSGLPQGEMFVAIYTPVR